MKTPRDIMNHMEVTPHRFLQMAHQWRHGSERYRDSDFSMYTMTGILPQYALEFVSFLREKEKMR